MTTPAVSVVIPTYQRRDLVQRAVASVLEQTFKDFELIVVDDGSADGTEAALGGLGGHIRYQWQENAGVAAARNAGLRLARGEIVAFLDSDDRWLPGHLAVVTEVLSRHPEAVLCTTAPRFDAGGNEPPSAAEVVDALPLLFAENIVGHPSAVTVRRAPITGLGGFDERLLVMQSWEMWLRLAQLGPFALLRRRTIVYQTTTGSLSRRSRNDRSLELIAESAAALASGVRRADAPELRARAAGLAAYFELIRALRRDDSAAARTALREACARLPELSKEPQLVANRLSLVKFGPEGRLRSFSTAATLWPEVGADTALYLRMHALVLAVRLGRWSEAAKLLRGWPVGATPRFVMRNTPVLTALGRRTFQKLLHRGQEVEQLAGRP